MDTFNFPYHMQKTKYPDTDKMQFGNSYEFAAIPSAPQQRIFTLLFPAMKFFHNSDGTLDASSNPTINYKAFRNFYEAHGTWTTFIYPHPEFGNVNVRFNKPLEDPDPIAGGDGAVSSFQLEFKEQP